MYSHVTLEAHMEPENPGTMLIELLEEGLGNLWVFDPLPKRIERALEPESRNKLASAQLLPVDE